MISRLGLWISAGFRRTAPDPFVIAVLLSVVVMAVAVVWGYPAAGGGPGGAARVGLGERAARVMDAWGPGLWSLLPFTMQMCVVLVTGHAVASSPPMRRVLGRVASMPGGTGSAAALVSVAACAGALVNWGLGLIVGAVLAREVGRSLSSRGIRAHYPLIVAAGYVGLMVWHGGLSGSAPLSMTTTANAARSLPAGVVEQFGPRGGGAWLGLDRTTFAWFNVMITGGLVVLSPVVFAMLAPRRVEEMRPAEEFTGGVVERVEEKGGGGERGGRVPEWLERSPVVAWVLAAGLVVVLVRFGARAGLATIGLNEVNGAMLALGLVLHGSARSYAAAVDEGARGCGGIIVQFPLYAGIMGVMRESGLAKMLADAFVEMSTPGTLPVLTFVSAGLLNLCIPSGGGQWAVQGPIALEAAASAGVDPGRMVMAVAYGDQLTNMLQPFWALPLLAVTGVRARDIVGYTAIVMVVAGVWIGVGLVVW